MTKTPRDVVVVGAGPVGLAVALGLARDGRSVLVLEKEASTSDHSRAPIIWPRTQEILAELGVVDSFLDEGIIRSDIQLWDVDHRRVLLSVPLHELREETAYPQLLICPQSTTERLLCEALQDEPSAEVHFSAAVTDLDLRDGHLAVHYEEEGSVGSVLSTFVAGCDGAHSRVREVMGTSFDGMTYRMEAALADLRLSPDRPDVRSPRMTRRNAVATAIRIGAGQWRVIMPRRPQEKVPLDQRIEQAASDLFEAVDYTTAWKSEFNLHRRISTPFTTDRVALAGDAAHLTSPVGGQGMNLGIQDANALKEALLAALHRGTLSPLTEYAQERRAAAESGVVRLTDRLTQGLLAGRGVFLVPALRAVGALLQLQPLRRRVMRRMAMLEDPSREEPQAVQEKDWTASQQP